MRTMSFFVFAFMVIACNSMQKKGDKEEQNDNPNFRSIEDSKETDSTKEPRSNNHNQEIYLDTISDPDTALAYFLFNTYEEFKPFQYQEEYQRLDLEYEKQIKLIKSIFSDKKNVDKAIKGINEIRRKFIKHIRKSVYDDYKKYHGVSGMSFDFLLKRRDSLVKPLLYELAKDKEAPKSEKKYAAKTLIEHYQDSTFKKLLNKN